MAMARAVRTLAADLARLVVPVQCAGCGIWDIRLCGECAAPWWEWPARIESGAPRLDIAGEAALPVWAITALDGPAESLVRAWKDGSRRDLDRWLGGAMRLAALRIGPQLTTLKIGTEERGDGDNSLTRASAVGTALTVVPAPARPASTRRRGIDLPAVLARAVTAGLQDAGVRARCTATLRIGNGESRGRSARARWRGASAGVAVRTPIAGPVVLVDDVVTTGATLAACTSALESRGAMVIGAFAAASAGSAQSGTQFG